MTLQKTEALRTLISIELNEYSLTIPQANIINALLDGVTLAGLNYWLQEHTDLRPDAVALVLGAVVRIRVAYDLDPDGRDAGFRGILPVRV